MLHLKSGKRAFVNDAAQARKELEQVQEESNRIVAKARADADAIIASGRADALKLQEELRAKARLEAEGIVKNAEREIQQQTTQSLAQIREEAVDLSLSIASKLIQRNLSKKDNETLIQDTLKQIRTPQA